MLVQTLPWSQPERLLPHRKLAIVGSHPSIHQTTVFDEEYEIWAFNQSAGTLPRVDVGFQMHIDWDSDIYGGFYKRWLRSNETVPIYMRRVYEDVPMARAYPFEEVYGLLQNVKHRNSILKLFSSSHSWAIALAVLQDRPAIDLYGIDMTDTEYENQKDGFAFWVGFAGGRGIELNIHCADNIFVKPLYGATPLHA